MIDVATVIEFPPGYHPDAPRAEVRALFFLAGWREHGSAARGMKPTLVCIDAPPPSVCWLAEQAGAQLVYRPPFAREDGSVFNRARAWDGDVGNAERRLVLDPEVLAVGDPSSALAILPTGTRLAAAPAEKAQVPDACWPAIYRAVGLPMPAARIQPLRVRLGLPAVGKGGDMPPFYHPAAILSPRAGHLGELWARHGAQLAAAWPTLESLSVEQRASMATLERVSLATALGALRASHEGGGDPLECHPLPRAWDGRRVYLEAGVGLGETALLHIPGLFSELTDLVQIQLWLQAYAVRWRERLLDAAARRGDFSSKTRWWVTWQARRMEGMLRRLYQRHVRPALRMGGEFG